MADIAAPLIATADHQLLDDALRWCAAAGRRPRWPPTSTARDASGARRRSCWSATTWPATWPDARCRGGTTSCSSPASPSVVADAVELGAVACVRRSTRRSAPRGAGRRRSTGGARGAWSASSVAPAGSGASTFAAALGLAGAPPRAAVAAARRRPAGVGSSCSWAASGPTGLRWPDLAATRGRLSAGSLADVLPVTTASRPLSWDRAGRGAAAGGGPVGARPRPCAGFDLVVADVPRTSTPLRRRHRRPVGADGGRRRRGHRRRRGRAAGARPVCAGVLVGRGGQRQPARRDRPGGGRGGARPPGAGAHRLDRRIRGRPSTAATGPGGRDRCGDGRAPCSTRWGWTTVMTDAARSSNGCDSAWLPTLPSRPPHTVADALRAEHQVAGSGTVLALVDRLRSEMLGAGPLDPVLALPGVTDVLVNGRRSGLRRPRRRARAVDVRFEDEESVRRLAQRMAAQAGRRLDDASPWVDARLARRHPPARRAGAARPARHGHLAAGAGAAIVLPRRAARLPARWRRGAPRSCAGSSRRGRHSWSRAAPGAARPRCWPRCWPWSTRATASSSSRTPPSCDPTTPTSSGSRRDLPTSRAPAGHGARSGAPGAAHAPRSARGRRGARRRGRRPAGRAQHRARGRVRHAARQLSADVPARFEALGVAAGLPRDAVHSQLAAGVDLVIHLGRGARRHTPGRADRGAGARSRRAGVRASRRSRSSAGARAWSGHEQFSRRCSRDASWRVVAVASVRLRWPSAAAGCVTGSALPGARRTLRRPSSLVAGRRCGARAGSACPAAPVRRRGHGRSRSACPQSARWRAERRARGRRATSPRSSRRSV